ncbi:MAG: serine/threonine protein phosphatase [Clostridia bacterium]|nr:serine/threonine protein phosphatase [Clostridia bacterium]
MKTIVIGDVHGRDDALRALLCKLQPDEKKDTLVMLGDLFDRGPESWEVFQTVQALAASFGQRFILLRGNHEDYLLRAQLTQIEKKIWNQVGRPATVSSFARHGMQMEDAIPWLSEHCRLFWRGDRFQCVHAGLLVEPIEVNDLETLIHDHTVTLRNQYAGSLTIVGHIALEAPAYFPGNGETVEELPEHQQLDLPEKGVICIDTGCGKGGKLTAMTVENGRFILESVS